MEKLEFEVIAPGKPDATETVTTQPKGDLTLSTGTPPFEAIRDSSDRPQPPGAKTAGGPVGPFLGYVPYRGDVVWITKTAGKPSRFRPFSLRQPKPPINDHPTAEETHLGPSAVLLIAVKRRRLRSWDWRTVAPQRLILTIAQRFQDAVGRVLVPSRSRNHLLEIAGELVVVSAGNRMPMASP